MLFDFNAYILSYRQSEYYYYDLIDGELKIFALNPYFSRDITLPRKQGGSCPLAYALKNLDGLHLTDNQKANFWKYTAEKTKVIADFISDQKLSKPDIIIPLPSSKDAVLTFTQCIYHSLDLKETAEIIPIFKKVRDIKSITINERAGIKNIELDTDNFSINSLKQRLYNKNIWLCDDLIASGTTMINAYHWLKSFGVKSVTGFSLFGCKNK
jgi:phosphoribosyl transferase domain